MIKLSERAENIMLYVILGIIGIVLVVVVGFINWLLRYGWFLLFFKNGG